VKPPSSAQLLRLAAILALVGLAFMVWSLLDPRPIPIMAAMSIGQGFGTLSFLLFAVVVTVDAWRASRRVDGKEKEE
jgi:membrane protein implicated in regulation of membrane protease activity